MRKVLFTYWLKLLRKSFFNWYGKQEVDEVRKKLYWKEGLRSLEVAGWSDWWEWKRGSRLFFWRWPVEFIDFALEGSKPCFFKLPELNMTRQGGIKDPNILKKVKLC